MWNVAQEQLMVVAKLLGGAVLAAIISIVLIPAVIARSAILLLSEGSLAAGRAIAADWSLLVGATSLGQWATTETTLLILLLLLLLGRLAIVLVATTNWSTGVTRLQTRWRWRHARLATGRHVVVTLLLLLLLVVLLLLGLLQVRRLLLLLVVVRRNGGKTQRSGSTGTARFNQVGVRLGLIRWLLVLVLLLLLVTQVAMVVGVAGLSRSRIVHGR